MKGQILVELQEFMGSDASIANAAWTSTYDKDKREDRYDDPEKVSSLVPRLIKEGHSVPIESVVLRFWIRLPVFADRQHMTHRLASHNGLSGRYRTLPEDFFGLPPDVLAIFEKTGQGVSKDANEAYDRLCTQAHEWYRNELAFLKQAEASAQITNAEFKRAREAIRGALPLSGMVERTSIFNLRSFANYQRLRNSDHAQPEIRQIAQLMLSEVKAKGVAPIAVATLENIGWRI